MTAEEVEVEKGIPTIKEDKPKLKYPCQKCDASFPLKVDLKVSQFIFILIQFDKIY